MEKIKLKFKILATLNLAFFLLAAPFATAREKAPFRAGESLHFELRWSFVSAGESSLKVLPITSVNGVEAYHFVMTARTNSFLDTFYKVRDRIDSYTDSSMNHSLLFVKKQKEGKTNRDIKVNFDWEKNEAHYSNFGEKRAPLPLLMGALDPLSAFYYTRSFSLKPGLVIERPVTDGKKCVIGRAKVVKRETIKVKGVEYDTFLITPELNHVGGVFKKSKNAKISVWVTADHRRIPVRIKSKVVVGSFVGELVSATGVD